MDNIFKTSDQGLGAYLVLLGYPCVGAIPSEETFTDHLGKTNAKMEFVFIDIPNPAELALDYMQNTAVGKLKEFHKNMQELRYMLRNPMSRQEYEDLKSGN